MIQDTQNTEDVGTAWDKLIAKLEGWWDTIIFNIPNFILAIIIFMLFYWLSRHLGKWISKYLRKFIKQTSVRNLIANIISVIFLSIGLFLALGILNLDEVLTSLLAGAGVAGLAVGLALQGTLTNTFSGIFLAINDVINIGDWVETNGFSGKVVEIDLRNLKLKEPDNNIVIIPNKKVLDSPFKNYGLTSRIRNTINCGVDYSSDLREVQEIAVNTIKDLYPPNSDEKIEFHFLEFADSSINFQLRFWVNATANITALEAKSEAIIRLKEEFDKQGINIPFPIRTIIRDEQQDILDKNRHRELEKENKYQDNEVNKSDHVN